MIRFKHVLNTRVVGADDFIIGRFAGGLESVQRGFGVGNLSVLFGASRDEDGGIVDAFLICGEDAGSLLAQAVKIGLDSGDLFGVRILCGRRRRAGADQRPV